MKKNIFIVLAIIFALFLVFIGWRVIQFKYPQHISLAEINQAPQSLEAKHIIYFDNQNDPYFKKYKQILDRYGLEKIHGINNKVVFTARFIAKISFKQIPLTESQINELEFIPSTQRNGYCQRTSLLLRKMLTSIGIYSRQWHFYDPKLHFSPHQFIEYYNPSLHKWVAIDTFYGVNYQKNNRLLSVADIYSLKNKNAQSLKPLLTPYTHLVEDNFDSIMNHWENDQLFLSKASDPHNFQNNKTTRYGAFGDLKNINKMPSAIKKVATLLAGRVNPDIKLIN